MNPDRIPPKQRTQPLAARAPSKAAAADAQPAERKGSKATAAKSTAGKSGPAKPASKEKLAAKAEGASPRPRSARASKAAEIQAAGTAKADGGHPFVAAPDEEMPKEAPTKTKGAAKPAQSKAMAEGKDSAGTSTATVGKAEMAEAARKKVAAPAGRGRRKAEPAGDAS